MLLVRMVSVVNTNANKNGGFNVLGGVNANKVNDGADIGLETINLGCYKGC